MKKKSTSAPLVPVRRGGGRVSVVKGRFALKSVRRKQEGETFPNGKTHQKVFSEHREKKGKFMYKPGRGGKWPIIISSKWARLGNLLYRARRGCGSLSRGEKSILL